MNPVILIPGIQGTKLANVNNKDFKVIWSGIRKFFDNLYDLLLDQKGETDIAKEVVIERQDVEDLAYSEIINFLKNRGYPVYIFGYDWRKSNLLSGKKLHEFVKMVKKKHGVPRVNFLTHSMGCLVFSGYFKQLTQYQIDTTINKVIFTVPPFLGSVEAMHNLVIGKSRLFNSSDDFRKLARTFPAVFELCPLYTDAVHFQSGLTFDLYNYHHWQRKPNKPDYPEIKEQFEVRLASLKQVRDQDDFIVDFSQLDEALRQKLLILAGDGEPTQRRIAVNDSSIDPVNMFRFRDYPPYQDERGDGTVHLDSACMWKDRINTITVKSRWLEKRLDGRMIMADWHSFFLNNGRVQNIIKRFFAATDTAALQANAGWFQSVGGEVEQV